MKTLLFSLFFFLFTAPLYAASMDIPNQVGVINQSISVNLSVISGMPPFNYAFHSSSIPREEWTISGNSFAWTPKKGGLYSGVFSVVDGKGDAAEDFVFFSILQNIPQQTVTPQETSVKVPVAPIVPDSQTVEYLHFNTKTAVNYYQPVALYYTRGVIPETLNLMRYQQGLYLHCSKDAKFRKNTYFPYGDAIQPPSWISSLRLENTYKMQIPTNALSFAVFDLPKTVSVSACGMVFSNQNASAYRVFSLASETMSEARAFRNGSLIPVTSGVIIVLTNEVVKSPIVTPSKASISADALQNPYLKSLFASPLPAQFFMKSEKNALTREQMAAMVMNTISPLSDSIQAEKEVKRTDWGFPDAVNSDYRTEIYLMKKYGYAKGIAEFFYPKQTANMKDFYFAIAKAFNIEVRWWEEKTLFASLKDAGLISNMQDFELPLTLERAAKVIFLTQEVLTRRGVQDFDETDATIVRAKNDALISQAMVDQSHKDRGISRETMILMMAKKFYDDFTIYNTYRSFYDAQGDKVQVFSDIKKDNYLMPAVFYLREQGVLPEDWKSDTALHPERLVTRGEAVEMILKAQKTWDAARDFYAKNIQSCFAKKRFDACLEVSFYDLQEDLKQAEKYKIAFYAKKQGIVSNYTDRFGTKLNLFVGSKAITLPEALEMFYALQK